MSEEIRGLRLDEMEAHSELVYQSYYEYVVSGERPFLSDPQWWLNSARCDPYYAPEQTRVLVVDGRLAASVTHYTRSMRVAGRLAKASCIGSVCTHPDFRRRGYVRRILADSMDWLMQEGYHFSLLYGMEAVYGGSGYTALGAMTSALSVPVREDLGCGVTARPADPGRDVPLLASIYDAFCSELTGPIVRNPAYWQGRVLGSRYGRTPASYQILELAGQPLAYFQADETCVNELAWASNGPEALAFIMRERPQPVRFSFGCSALLAAVRTLWAQSGYADLGEHPGTITLSERYQGLWKYIADPQGLFPEFSDTAGLKRFLREQEYVFWPADGF